MRGAISAANRAYQWHYRFNPRPSCEGRPDSAVLVGILDGSFNPRPSCEGRLGGLGHINALEVFQSTPLMRGATTYDRAVLFWSVFQSTPLMRGATRMVYFKAQPLQFQSTPLMRGATSPINVGYLARLFQSTPLMRGATSSSAARSTRCRSFNPRPSCEETCRIRHGDGGTQVSIHAPHARGDVLGLRAAPAVQVSIHAPHARGDTRSTAHTAQTRVSIHAPHARGDLD